MLQPRMTMARTIKFYKLPEEPLTPGLRPMETRDIPQVQKLLNSYLDRYSLAAVFSEEEVAHWCGPGRTLSCHAHTCWHRHCAGSPAGSIRALPGSTVDGP